MQQNEQSAPFLTGGQQRLIGIAFLGLTIGGVALWLAMGDSVYLNMLITGLMNCF